MTTGALEKRHIQPDLYRKRGSVMQLTTSSKDSLCAGRVQLQLGYAFSTSDFIVTLVEARLFLKLDSCHVAFSVGDDSKRREAQVSCRNPSPTAEATQIENQIFKFPMSYEDLMDRTLTIEMTAPKPNGKPAPWCKKKEYRNVSGLGTTVVGRSCIPLTSLNPSDDILIWVDLETVNEVEHIGEVNVCLQYLPSAERLNLTIHQARRLDGSPSKLIASNNINMVLNLGTYVRACLFHDEKLLKKRKTNVRKATGAPVWNEVLTFQVPLNVITKCRLEVAVIDSDRFGNNQAVGEIAFDAKYGGGATAKHWHDAILGRNNLPQWFQLKKCKSV
ncbi:Synaptotagmin-C [Aphelenchoides avenae]|nr:Synaptotagmin-C [Aphelenchus avenae]